MIPGKQYTPELVLGIAWRRKWHILLPAIVVSSIVVAVTYNLPNQYRSDTLILVLRSACRELREVAPSRRY